MKSLENSKFLNLLIFSSRVGKGKGEGEGEIEETRCRVAEILKTFAKNTEKERLNGLDEENVRTNPQYRTNSRSSLLHKSEMAQCYVI